MKVETYETTEQGIDGPIENFDECKALADKLGLEGQVPFFNGEKKEVAPYRKMTAQENLVYTNLLSTKTRLNKYSDSAIPLRVLQVASHAVDIGICDFIEVWHKPNADIKDPLLVGVKGSEDSGQRFILARWGEELLPFIELCKIVKPFIAASIKEKLDHAKREIDSVTNVDILADRAILTGSMPSISCYVNL